MANEYRLKETGEIKTKEELIVANSNISFPKIWDDSVLEILNVDEVLNGSKPTVSGPYKHIVRDGEIQNDEGQWIQNFVEQDMFKDTTNQAGEAVTKAEQETAYQATLDANAAAQVRYKRDGLLAETDFYALSDVTMTDAMTTYRQALRDITAHSNFPNNLTDDDWPEKP